MKALTALALVLALAACKQDQPAPSQKIADAADELIAKASGTAPVPMLGEGAYAPRDECVDIPGASEFRESLALAVTDRDVDGLVALAANDVRLDFGGGEGASLLHQHLTQADRSLWDELDDLLTLGCAKNDQGGITIPWYSDQDFGDVDPMLGMIVTGENIPLLAELPATGAAKDKKDKKADKSAEPQDAPGEVASLSWDVVELVGDYDPSAPYAKVRTTDGKTMGYVATDKLRSLVGYRLIASSRNGKWNITSLIAGD